MIYQDIWLNGKLIKQGIRECASRYEIIYNHCRDNKPKSVLDIGANMSYFGLRLIEDFGCSVIAFEFDHFDLRMEHVKANKTNRLLLLNKKLSLPYLEILKDCCQFDLVLAMSILHHLPGNSNKWIEAIRQLGDNVIMEFAMEDSKRVAKKKDYSIPQDAVILGYGDSHLKEDILRPIILLKNNNRR